MWAGRLNTVFGLTDMFGAQGYGSDYGFLGCRLTEGITSPNTACGPPVQVWLSRLGYNFSVVCGRWLGRWRSTRDVDRACVPQC